MDERRLKGLMGLCVRAGQAVFGETRRGNGRENGILFRTDDQLPVTGRQTNKQIEAGNGRGKNCEWQR